MDSIGVDLQLQVYILASVFGAVSLILIFFLAGVCGQLSKVKRQQQKLHLEQLGQNASYDNYAYNSRTIQPDEELSRRGYTMYDPYRNSNAPNVHPNNANTLKTTNTQEIVQHSLVSETIATSTATGDAGQDEASAYSIANAETVVMTGNDIEMKIQRKSYPPEFPGIPPPPAFVNRFGTGTEPHTSTKNDEQQ